jgi:hypothetical protein
LKATPGALKIENMAKEDETNKESNEKAVEIATGKAKPGTFFYKRAICKSVALCVLSLEILLPYLLIDPFVSVFISYPYSFSAFLISSSFYYSGFE